MLKDLLTIEMTFSEYHLIFPRLILWVLIFFGLLTIILHVPQKIKQGKFKPSNFKFFVDNYDKVKLYGTIGMLVGYVFLLELLGFIVATVLFVFFVSILFVGNTQRKTIIVSLVNSVVTSVAVWFIFAYLFDITLP